MTTLLPLYNKTMKLWSLDHGPKKKIIVIVHYHSPFWPPVICIFEKDWTLCFSVCELSALAPGLILANCAILRLYHFSSLVNLLFVELVLICMLPKYLLILFCMSFSVLIVELRNKEKPHCVWVYDNLVIKIHNLNSIIIPGKLKKYHNRVLHLYWTDSIKDTLIESVQYKSKQTHTELYLNNLVGGCFVFQRCCMWL